jgi:hypothetical protein
VHNIYAQLRTQFPNAIVNATSLDAFVEAILPYSSSFPVVTAEMGDSWNWGKQSAYHFQRDACWVLIAAGISADPYKQAGFRELCRVWSDLRKDETVARSAEFQDWSMALLKLPEHNWVHMRITENINEYARTVTGLVCVFF